MSPNLIQASSSDIVDEIIKEIKEFSKMKRTWHKAYELLEAIIMCTHDLKSQKERNIFKYQFLLNFLTKSPTEKMNYILD